jgi:ribosomal protein L27
MLPLRNGIDAESKKEGCLRFSGQYVTSGAILVKQTTLIFYPGEGTGIGQDNILFALFDGMVEYHQKDNKYYVSVNHKEK